MDRYWLIKGSVIFAAIVFAVQGRVDEQPERQSAPSKIIGSLFLDIKATDDHQLYAVGERGHICRFDGRQWLMDYSPVRSNLNRIYQSGEGTLWAVGHDGVILKGTQNGWRLIRKIVDDKPLFDIHFFNNDEAVVIGAYGTFLRSYDDGQNWQAELHDSLLPEEDLAYVQEVQQTSPDDYEQVVSSVLPHLNQLTRLANGQLMLLMIRHI